MFKKATKIYFGIFAIICGLVGMYSFLTQVSVDYTAIEWAKDTFCGFYTEIDGITRYIPSDFVQFIGIALFASLILTFIYFAIDAFAEK